MVKQEGIGGFNKKNNIVKVKIIVSRLLYNNWMQFVLEDIKEGFGINIKSQWDPPTIVIGY